MSIFEICFILYFLNRDVTRTLIGEGGGGVFIHIFMF